LHINSSSSNSNGARRRLGKPNNIGLYRV